MCVDEVLKKSVHRRKLVELDTYVFVDASNIRASCLSSCGFRLDFKKLMQYLKNKYSHLKEVSYYEGIADDDSEKRKTFEKLSKIGYEVKTLKRKTYTDSAVFRTFRCKKCKTENRVKVLSEVKKMKSNVDVYLASEMVQVAFLARKMTHIIVVSCDGDYADAIRIALGNQKVRITVIATPSVKKPRRNTLSTRLKELSRELPAQYKLFNIEDIRDEVS